MNEAVPIVAIVVGIPLMIPIVANFAAHQRKMAEIMRGTQSAGNDQALAHVIGELQALRSNMNQMNDRLNQLAISVDGPTSTPKQLDPPSLPTTVPGEDQGANR